MTNYAIDLATGALEERGAVALPSRVQYAWPHARLPVVYAGCADRGASGGAQPFYLCALARDEAGDLSLLGDPVALPARPIHVTADGAGRYVLVAYGDVPGLSVHEVRDDGAIGAEVPRAGGFAFGVKPHQVRVLPSDDRAVIVSRGVKGFGKPSYVAGEFDLVRFDRGEVENVAVVAPSETEAPRGFNPRNVDFHPDEPLMFATLEAQNELAVFRLDGDAIAPAPLFAVTILEHPEQVHKRQDGGEVHVHPGGHTVYVANRNDGYVGGQAGPSWLTPEPIPVFPGGENSVAVFRLDEAGGGEPTLVQHVDTGGLAPRTIALDAAGRVLVAANFAPTVIEEAGRRRDVPANLAVFTIAGDGTLTPVHRLNLDTGREKVGWMGVVG